VAEVEIHTGHDHASDHFGQRVGVAVGLIGIALAVVTIGSHRAHTAAVIDRTEANDQWAFYQAKKIREHVSEVGIGLAESLATDPAKTAAIRQKWTQDRERYAKDTEEIQHEARSLESRSELDEQRALRLDLGEGFLELGLVLSSLYFLSKKRLFPTLGAVAAALGLSFGLAALFI
jgi:hypothetical protein